MAKKKRQSIWDDDYKPYGTYRGRRGSPEEWKGAFRQMFNTVEEAQEELGADHPLKILGLNIGATIDEIKSAFRKLVLRFGPDKSEENPSLFRKIMAAYKVLMG
jgi:DnaJ-class molecular chaperone